MIGQGGVGIVKLISRDWGNTAEVVIEFPDEWRISLFIPVNATPLEVACIFADAGKAVMRGESKSVIVDRYRNDRESWIARCRNERQVCSDSGKENLEAFEMEERGRGAHWRGVSE